MRARYRIRLAAIGVAALAIRVVYALTLAPKHNLHGPTGDRFFFTETARLLAGGHGFVEPFGWVVAHHAAPSAGHPPLWSLVLALPAVLGADGYTAARLTGAVAGALAAVAIGLVARRMAGDRAGLLAAGLAAVYPVFISSDASGMSEALYLLLVALSVLAIVVARARPGIGIATVSGVAIALASLTRTEGLLLLPLVAWPALWGRSMGPPPWMLPLVATVAAALTIAPWTVRNWIALGSPVVISTNEATVIAGANCPQTYGGVDLGSWSVGCLLASGPRRALTSYDEVAAATAWRRAGLRYASHHTGRLPKVMAVRVLRTWNLWQPLRQATQQEGQNRTVAKAAALVFLALLLPAGLLGAWRGRLRRDHLLILAALGLMVSLTSAIGWGNPRFLRPAELALIVSAAAAAARAYEARIRSSPSGAWASRPT